MMMTIQMMMMKKMLEKRRKMVCSHQGQHLIRLDPAIFMSMIVTVIF